MDSARRDLCANTRGLPGHPRRTAWLVDALGDAGPTLVVPMILGAVCAGLRALEPYLPAWLTSIVLGSNTPPVYSPAGDED